MADESHCTGLALRFCERMSQAGCLCKAEKSMKVSGSHVTKLKSFSGTYEGSSQHSTKQREREQEEEHEQEHLLVHLESSWFEMRSRDRFLLIRKNKEPREGSQAGRREVRIIHHQEGLYRWPKATVHLSGSCAP